MTLHLVGREPKKRARKKYERSPLLTPIESQRFRQAMQNLKDRHFDTWDCLAAAMRVSRSSLVYMMCGKARVSGDMIVRAMRASGLSYDDLVGPPKLVTRAS
jgi:hypothetical protein